MESRRRVNLTVTTVIVVLASIFAHSVAKKEFVDPDLTQEDADLLYKLIKRLGNADYNYNPEGSDQPPNDSYGKQSSSRPNDRQENACVPTIKQGVIIKATESINRGADYIDSIKGVQSNADCLARCCQNSSCDVAVYQDKKDHYCYLFRCGDKCLFKEFSGYFVNNIKHGKRSEESEQDLQNLNSELVGNNQGQESKEDSSFTDGARGEPEKKAPVQIEETTLKTTGPAPTKPVEPVIAPHSVGLQGFCRQDRHCEDPNAVCKDGNCLCKNGYYDKEGLCRKVCPPSNFECFELGSLSRGPECVPRYQVCDSYMQCSDGSDEFNCENIDFPSRLGQSKSDSVSKSQASAPEATDEKVSTKTKEDQSGKVPGTIQDVKSTPRPTKPPTTSTTKKNKLTKISAKTDKPVTATTKSPSDSHGSNKRVYMASEKVIIASTTSSAEGPIIALSLGLAFTLILIVLLGCRLRNMRHRLRKGRPLHQNEADYLINGMYL